MALSNYSNSKFEPATNIAPTVTAADYDTFAQHLYNKGAFNVNSTSKEAWALFLASGTNEALPILNMLTAERHFSERHGFIRYRISHGLRRSSGMKRTPHRMAKNVGRGIVD